MPLIVLLPEGGPLTFSVKQSPRKSEYPAYVGTWSVNNSRTTGLPPSAPIIKSKLLDVKILVEESCSCLSSLSLFVCLFVCCCCCCCCFQGGSKSSSVFNAQYMAVKMNGILGETLIQILPQVSIIDHENGNYYHCTSCRLESLAASSHQRHPGLHLVCESQFQRLQDLNFASQSLQHIGRAESSERGSDNGDMEMMRSLLDRASCLASPLSPTSDTWLDGGYEHPRLSEEVDDNNDMVILLMMSTKVDHCKSSILADEHLRTNDILSQCRRRKGLRVKSCNRPPIRIDP